MVSGSRIRITARGEVPSRDQSWPEDRCVHCVCVCVCVVARGGE